MGVRFRFGFKASWWGLLSRVQLAGLQKYLGAEIASGSYRSGIAVLGLQAMGVTLI